MKPLVQDAFGTEEKVEDKHTLEEDKKDEEEDKEGGEEEQFGPELLTDIVLAIFCITKGIHNI